MDKFWNFPKPRQEPRLDWKPTRFLPPEVELTNEDLERIGVCRQLNSISRAYMLGLLAGMRRSQP